MTNSAQAWQGYLRIWRGVLREFDWTNEAIADWAQQYEEEASAPGWFYTQPPGYYLADVLVPDDLAADLPPKELKQSKRDLEGAITDKEPTRFDPPDFDFGPGAAKRVREILARYRER